MNEDHSQECVDAATTDASDDDDWHGILVTSGAATTPPRSVTVDDGAIVACWTVALDSHNATTTTLVWQSPMALVDQASLQTSGDSALEQATRTVVAAWKPMALD